MTTVSSMPEKESKLLREIAKVYSKYSPYPVTRALILGKRGRQFISEARMVFMYITKQKTNYTLECIGELVNRDHSTVIANSRVIEARIETKQLLIPVEELERIVA